MAKAKATAYRQESKQRKRPHRIRLDATPIDPKPRFNCAICWFTHADVKVGSNYYHAECLQALMREYHPAPDHILLEANS